MSYAENEIDPFNSTPEDFADPVDEEYLWTCCYPDKCLMPGAHTRDECHTVEDMEAYYAEMENIPSHEQKRQRNRTPKH